MEPGTPHQLKHDVQRPWQPLSATEAAQDRTQGNSEHAPTPHHVCLGVFVGAGLHGKVFARGRSGTALPCAGLPCSARTRPM